MTDADDLIEQAEDLKAREQASGGPEDLVNSLVKGLAKQGRYLKWVAVSVALDVALSIGLAVAFVNIAENSNAAAVAKTAAHSSCLATNDSRASAKAIWDHVLGLVVPQSAASAATIADVKSLVALTYAPRECK